MTWQLQTCDVNGADDDDAFSRDGRTRRGKGDGEGSELRLLVILWGVICADFGILVFQYKEYVANRMVVTEGFLQGH